MGCMLESECASVLQCVLVCMCACAALAEMVDWKLGQ